MKLEILEQELKKLYPHLERSDIQNVLEEMYRNRFRRYETDDCFMLYKRDYRLHCCNVVIVDTLISTKKGEGTKAIEYLKNKYPFCTIQLDCHIDNEAIEFYKKLGFKKRAWSLVK